MPWNLPAGVDCTTSGVLACESSEVGRGMGR
jgi:hypothetical protein